MIVDGMNVIGSRPDGWWRDREGAARRLVAVLSGFAAETGADITVVLDGRPLPGLAGGPVTVRYAARPGRDAADDRIVELVTADSQPSTLEVVTADRVLRARVASLGSRVSGPRALLAELAGHD